jgi:phosphatidylinositol-3-phosphatase
MTSWKYVLSIHHMYGVASFLALALFGSFGSPQVHAQTNDAPAHNIQTVFIILMENHNWTGDASKLNIKGNPAAPYINNTLLPMASHAEQYFNPPNNHPSLPNYLWLEAGGNFGILNDILPRHANLTTHKHLVRLLEEAGMTWKAYEEDITGTNCPLTYAENDVNHDPFVYFEDTTNDYSSNSAECIAHVRPYTELASDLAAGTVAQYNFITPNTCDDMHDSCGPLHNPIAQGDAWLSANVPMILGSTAYQHAVLFITWDEADRGDGPIGMIVLSPFAKGSGYENSIHYTHGSTLRTMQEIFGVTPFLRDADRETDLSDLFSQFP